MKINFLLNWTWCSGNLRGRASASWWAADTSSFMRGKTRALPFPLPLPGLWEGSFPPPPFPIHLQNHLTWGTINAVAAGYSSFTDGWIDCSLVSAGSTGTHTCPSLPSSLLPLERIITITWILLTPATGVQSETFGFSYKSKRNSVLWQSYTQILCNRFYEKTYGKQEHILGTDKKPQKPELFHWILLECLLESGRQVRYRLIGGEN